MQVTTAQSLTQYCKGFPYDANYYFCVENQMQAGDPKSTSEADKFEKGFMYEVCRSYTLNHFM